MERCILCAKNTTSDAVNKSVSDLMDWEEAEELLSFDSVSEEDQTSLYPEEVLHTLTPSGMPPHSLLLKIGMPVVLLRNLNPLKGDCNGTRYVVRRVSRRLLELETDDVQNPGSSRTFLCPRVLLLNSEVTFPTCYCYYLRLLFLLLFEI